MWRDPQSLFPCHLSCQIATRLPGWKVVIEKAMTHTGPALRFVRRTNTDEMNPDAECRCALCLYAHTHSLARARCLSLPIPLSRRITQRLMVRKHMKGYLFHKNPFPPPSYVSPLGHDLTPAPCLLPFMISPSYLLPDQKVFIPLLLDILDL